LELLAAIRQRRSIRDYKPDPVPANALRQLVMTACLAPNAMNAQPWHFTIVTDAMVMDEISARAKAWSLQHVPELGGPGHFRDLMKDPQFQLFYHAPALIVISTPEADRWATEDCAVAAQTLMLAALDQELGSCWIGFAQGWLNSGEGHPLLGLPATNRIVAPIAVGYPRAPLPPVLRKSPVINWVGKLAASLPGKNEDADGHHTLNHP
jgi:nitroreductase